MMSMTLSLVLCFLMAEVVELLAVYKSVPNGGRRYCWKERVAFTNNPDTWVYRASLHH